MPLLWISVCFIAGLFLGKYLSWNGYAWMLLAGIALLLWPLLRRLPARGALRSRLRWLGRVEPRLFVPPLLLAACLFLGAARITLHVPDVTSGHIAAINDQGRFRIRAVVAGPPDRRDQTTLLRLKVEQVAALDADGNPGTQRAAHGLLMAMLPGRSGYQYGDRLELDGSPVTPPENEEFSYRDYLARQHIYTYLTYPRTRRVSSGSGSPLMAAIYRLRDWAYAQVYHLFPAPEAPLLAGILLGLDNDLPPDLARAFQDTGTAHVIAISGFNIAILAELFARLFGKILSRWWATLAAISAIAGYTILVGGTPSVVRAAIMGSMALVAGQIGRRSTGYNSLALTAALMSLQNPRLPWDASFQLSFGATLGLVLYGDRLQNGFTGWLARRLPVETARKISAPVGEYVLMTLAAQALTLPVILYHFQRLSISSLLANPLILPVQPLVMVLSGAAVLAGAVFDPLAHLLGWLAWPLSAYTIRMVEFLANMPGGVLVIGEIGPGGLAALFAVALSPLVVTNLPGRIKAAARPALLLACAGLLAAGLWRTAYFVPDNRLHLYIIDIEGSQAVLIRAPLGQTLLINGGPSARLLGDAVGRWTAPLERSLGGVLLNDPQASVAGGLPSLLERYPTGQVWWGMGPPGSRAWKTLSQRIQKQQIPSHRLVEGEALDLGGGARLSVLAVSEEGSALLLTWQNFRTLIPGGFSPRELVAKAASPTLLLLEARDLEENPPAEWQALSPQAVITAAVNTATAKNSAAPAPTANWLTMRPQGWFAVTTDGSQMWVEEKK